MKHGLRLALFGFVLWLAQPAAALPDTAEVMTLHEAAAFLRIDRAALGQLAAWGQVPGRRIGAQWRFSRSALLAWLGGGYITPPPAAAAPALAIYPSPPTAPRQPLPPATLAQVTGRGTAAASTAGPAPIGEAPEADTADDVFLRDQRLLLGAGDVTLELGLFYARSDDQAFVLSGGAVALGVIERDSFISSLTLRYGLFPDTEIFAGGSLRRASSQTFAGAAEVASSDDTRFGDIGLGLRRTVIHEGLGVPDVILTVEGAVPTDGGSVSLGGGVALVKSYDPVVLFASTGYRHTFARDFTDLSLIEAENRIDATLGFAFALNDTLTLSTALSGAFTDETAFTNATLRSRESFSLQFGLTSLLAPGFYIEPTVSFNLNGDGNDVVLGLSMPYTF